MGIDPQDPSVTEALRAWHVQHDAGIALAPALQLAASACMNAEARAAIERAARLAESGTEIRAILKAMEPALAAGEQEALAAGWESGRFLPILDSVLKQRELWHQTRAGIRSKLILPCVVFVLACVIAPLPGLILSGHIVEYLLRSALPLVLAFFLARYLNSVLHARTVGLSDPTTGAPRPPTRLDRVLLALPFAARVERLRNLSECSGLLAQLLGAGVLMSRALEITARTLPNGYYREGLHRCVPQVRDGNSLSSSLADKSLWPPDFMAVINVGEKSGNFEKVFQQYGNAMRDSYARSITIVGEWTPRLIYAFIALYIILQIILLVLGIASYYQQMS